MAGGQAAQQANRLLARGLGWGHCLGFLGYMQLLHQTFSHLPCQVDMLTGQPDAESCCRACRAWARNSSSGSSSGSGIAPPTACKWCGCSCVCGSRRQLAPAAQKQNKPSVPMSSLLWLRPCSWNYCDQSGGCSFTTDDCGRLELPQGGCELRFQVGLQGQLLQMASGAPHR